MPNMEVTRSLSGVREALGRKGFEDLGVTHYDNTPGGHVVLHDDHGRLARGEGRRIEQAIEEADAPDELWSALDRAGLTVNTQAVRS